MRIVVVYNNASGGKYTLARIRRICRENGVTISYSFTVKQLSSPKLTQLVKRGVTVAAVGGDGTINSVARLVVGTRSVLLPLPGGTLNHFVRDLGMNGSVDELMLRIGKARERKVDVGYVNDELFLNTSSLGLYPFALLDRKNGNRFFGKWMLATLTTLRQLMLFHRHSLVIDGKKINSPFVFVGNNVYDIASSLIPQRTKMTGSILTVMVATSRSRWHLIRAGFNVVRGRVSHLDDFYVSKRKTVDIYTHADSLPVSFDGEVKHLEPPFRYRSESGALRVLVIK